MASICGLAAKVAHNLGDHFRCTCQVTSLAANLFQSKGSSSELQWPLAIMLLTAACATHTSHAVCMVTTGLLWLNRQVVRCTL